MKAPASAMTAAGAMAHRCGWLVRRCESAARVAQAQAKVSSTAPVMMCSGLPASGTTTRTTAITRPEMSDPATTGPICPTGMWFPDWDRFSGLLVMTSLSG